MIDYTFGIVLMSTTILGITAGAIGVFAVLRQQSLLGDAISHAAFPGVVIAFLCSYSKNPAILMIGGACAGALGALLVTVITHYSSLKKDAALGIVLSVFFGVGLMLMTYVQKKPVASQAILNKFLFGNAATLLSDDMYAIGGIGAIVLIGMFLLRKEFVLLAFDTTYAQALGYNVLYLDITLTLLLVCAIIMGLQTVGVVLMSTLLIAPAAAARQWTNSLYPMIGLASSFGAIASVLGAMISSYYDRMPTGPVIVILLTLFVFFSLVVAPYVMQGRRCT